MLLGSTQVRYVYGSDCARVPLWSVCLLSLWESDCDSLCLLAWTGWKNQAVCLEPSDRKCMCVCVCVCVLGLHNCKGSLCIHFNSFKKKKQRPKNQLKWIRLMSDFMRAQQTHLLLQSRAEVSGRWTSDRQGGAWQGDVWQSPLPHAAAVVGDLERTPLVVVLSTSCTGEESLLIIIKIHSSTEVLIPKLIKEPSPTHGLWETPPVPPALPGWDQGPPREAS